ncbi:MAG TPA: ribosome-associated translation inhibitor RaiA [Bacteroidales bacterium]|nr:ribosome-associated translation inhibitor RaiA [Bacteroidales bacterium]HSA43849.1 ribosome-associated translation inhibitor RaiA [Bacteroidales bacterium]
MKVNINAVRFKTDKKLEDYINDKIGKLNQYFDGVIGSEITLRLDSNEKVKDKIVEIRVMIPGNDLYAKKESKSFEEATTQAVEAVKKQLTKYKEKVRGL